MKTEAGACISGTLIFLDDVLQRYAKEQQRLVGELAPKGEVAAGDASDTAEGVTGVVEHAAATPRGATAGKEGAQGDEGAEGAA